MVFSTKDDFVVKRPISEKLLINSFKYEPNLENRMRTCAALGFKYINLSTWFENSNNGAGLPKFDGEIEKIKESLNLCEKYHLKPMINFGGQLGWGWNNETDAPYSPEQMTAIKDEFKNIFTEFAGKGIIWAGWNEPNIFYWANDTYGNDRAKTASWIRFDKWMIAQAKLADKDALEVVGGLANMPINYYKILDQMKELRLFEEANGVLTHLYVSTSDDMYHSPEVLLNLASIPQTDLPRVSNESGFPHKADPSNEWQGAVTEQEALQLTKRLILIQDYLGYAIIGIFRDVDPFYGILNENGTKANFLGLAISNLLHDLYGYTLEEKIYAGPHANYADDLYVMRYKNPTKPDRLAYWTPTRFGNHKVVVDGTTLHLNFKADVQIIEINPVPNQKDYFLPIEPETTYGTKVVM